MTTFWILDHYDIKMLTYLMVARLATLCPTAVLQRLDRLVEPLRSTCTTKVKANAVKQEYEKQDELKVCNLSFYSVGLSDSKFKVLLNISDLPCVQWPLCSSFRTRRRIRS